MLLTTKCLLIYPNLESALHQGVSRLHFKTAGNASPQGMAELRDPRGPVCKAASSTLSVASWCLGGAESTMDKKHAGKRDKKGGQEKEVRQRRSGSTGLLFLPTPARPDS